MKTEGVSSDSAVTLVPVAAFRTYDALLEVMRDERVKSGLRMMDLDHISGLHDGYSAKVLSPSQERRLGVLSLPVLA